MQAQPLVLKHSDLSSTSLADDLAKNLDAEIAGAGAAPELVDELHTLAAQGAALAVAHKLRGAGSVSIVPGAVVVKSADDSFAGGQPIDLAKVASRKEARVAAARAASRKKIVSTVRAAGSAVATAVRTAVAAVVPGPRTSAPSKAPKPPVAPAGTPPPKPGNPTTPAAAAAPAGAALASTQPAKTSATKATVPPPAKR